MVWCPNIGDENRKIRKFKEKKKLLEFLQLFYCSLVSLILNPVMNIRESECQKIFLTTSEQKFSSWGNVSQEAYSRDVAGERILTCWGFENEEKLLWSQNLFMLCLTVLLFTSYTFILIFVLKSMLLLTKKHKYTVGDAVSVPGMCPIQIRHKHAKNHIRHAMRLYNEIKEKNSVSFLYPCFL